MRNTQTGFALLTPEARRQVAASGGTRSHALGKAHRWTVEEARDAGRKGGLARQARARRARQAHAEPAR